MFAAFHELLVDHFARIVFPCLDVNGLLDDSISSASQSLACAILGPASGETTNRYREGENRRPGTERWRAFLTLASKSDVEAREKRKLVDERTMGSDKDERRLGCTATSSHTAAGTGTGIPLLPQLQTLLSTSRSRSPPFLRSQRPISLSCAS